MNHNRYKATFTGADAPAEYSEVTTWAFMGPFFLYIVFSLIEGMLHYGTPQYQALHSHPSLKFVSVASPIVVFVAKLIAQNAKDFGIVAGSAFGLYGVYLLSYGCYLWIVSWFPSAYFALSCYHLITGWLFIHYYLVYKHRADH